MPAEDRPPLNDLCDGDPLARELARLKPAEPQLDMRVLMFEAGRASRSVAAGRWRRACLVSAVALVGSWVGFLWFPERMPEPLARTVPVSAQPDEQNLRQLGNAIREAASDPPYPAVPYQPSPIEPITFRPGKPTPERDDAAEYLRVRDAVIRVGLPALPAFSPSPGHPAAGPGSPLVLPPGLYAHPLLWADPGSEKSENSQEP